MVGSQATLDVYLGFVAFFSGVGLTLLYVRFAPKRAAAKDEPTPADQPPLQANDASRAEMAIRQLHDMALNVASDVNAHKTIVGQISSRLAKPEGTGADQERMISEAVGELLQANSALQARLEIAEQRIQAQAQEIQLQQSVAQTDALTGLANRRAFDGVLQESLERLRQVAEPFSVVMFDVDFFKQLNDVHGHLAGDEVLRSLGKLLPAVLKSSDVACRYGGEEFAIVLRGANILEAQAIGERIRAAIEALTVSAEGKSLKVTASLGAAEGAAADQALTVVRRVDDCVYASKRAGRNCFHWHNGAECVLATTQPSRVVTRRPPAADAQPLASPLLPAKMLPDRAMMTNLLQRAVAESDRSGQPLALLHVVIRQFEALAGQHGSEVPELAEAHVAQAVSQVLREMDVVGHWSPGEFMIVLPRCTEPAARIVAQRVAASVPRSVRLSADIRVTLDLATGTAAKQFGESAEHLHARAAHAAARAADASAAEPAAPAEATSA